MQVVPPALILVNQTISENVKENLIRQLFIDAVYDGYVFDDIITANSSYPQQVRQAQLRIMVLKDFHDLVNREIFDVVIFVSNGLAAMEVNKFGPHGHTWPVRSLSWGELGIF